MIKYTLRCKNYHQFDSWFASSDAFDKLKSSDLLSCEVCGTKSITKSLMAPSVKAKDEAKKSNRPLRQQKEKEANLIQELRKKVEKSCEYVGEKFADEARSIHYGDAPERSIYGKTTLQTAKSLSEEGIPVMPLPWYDRKSN